MNYENLNPLINQDYADLIIDNLIIDSFKDYTQITEISYKYSVINIPVSILDKCSLGTDIKYYMFPKCYTLQSLIALENTGVNTIQSNPSFRLNGSGVLIGIIDTGIDYQNNLFRYSDGTTRIASIWDQTINNTTLSPLGLNYGAEYYRDDIDLALNSKNPLDIVPSVDSNGHGTAIAGIIGGSQDIQNNFSGVVTQSEFIIVKLKEAKEITKQMFSINNNIECYQETDILFAIKYITEYATILKRPVSICITVGTNQGSRTGLEILSSYISRVCRVPGIGVSIAAGNEGNLRRHYSGISRVGMSYEEFSMVVDKKDKMFFLEIWQITPQRLAIEIISPTGEITQRINPNINNCYQHNFLFENSKVWINNLTIESITGFQLVLLRFENTMDGIWNFRLYNLDNIDTSFNVWLPSGNIISRDTFLFNSTPDITITSPGDSDYATTFGAYDVLNNSIHISSGRGYTNLGIVKPDLASPGVNILAPTLNKGYEVITGTSVAAAFASGIIAMILEWGVVNGNWSDINGIEIKELLIRGATRDRDIMYPNNIWGYGKINIYGVFDKLRV